MLPDFGPTLHLERPLARNAFGDAWAARTADGVASMVIALEPELQALAAGRDRLVAALRALAGEGTATDGALLPVLDVVVAADGRVMLVLPLEERAPASERLARGKVFATAEVAAAVRAIGEALGHAHAAGRRHGALSTGLLFVGGEQPPRVLGLGVVEAFVAAGAKRPDVVDTLEARAFAAPELRGDDPAGAPAALADVYALGATLYACMTGRPPFGGRTTSMTMAAVLADEGLTGEVPIPRRDTREQAEATERLTQALLRAVERAPADRWPTMGDFVRALDPRRTSPTPPPQAVPTPPRARRVPRAGCLPALMLVTGVVSLLAVALLPR